ncbi:hypothetical protein [Sansalvadorimonas verongulae]|uniref:hypothetical protein n=1 Tax=Sansalvadorimonas verongulae TaxID=2172824 RepID=UPI0012BB5535|nr:hypothetical protein [Sansalvadorimonas verongulae]MTI13466.1 hypothetical protein [Sansalvadorimonas verongulae]
MKWILALLISVVSLSSYGAEEQLTKGILEGINNSTRAVIIGSREYPMTDNVKIESPYLESNHYFLLPGLTLSLHSEDGKKVSRIVIHGPYSLLREAVKH